MKAPNYVNNVFQFRGLLPTLQANIGMPYFSFCPEDRLDNALQRKPLFSAGASVRVQARQTFPLEWYCLRERITVYRLNSFPGSLPLLIPYRPIKPSNSGATKAFFFSPCSRWRVCAWISSNVQLAFQPNFRINSDKIF